MIQFVVSLVQNRPVVVVQWLAHLTGIFRVSGPALGGDSISTYVLILKKFLLLYVYMLVYVMCQYLPILLFFRKTIHNHGSFRFFPRGEVGKLKFLSNSQIGPYSLMPIATSPMSYVASLTQPSPQQTCCSLMLDVLKDLEFKTFLAFNVISVEQATTKKDRFLVESQMGVFSRKGLQVFNMEVGTRLRGEWLHVG